MKRHLETSARTVQERRRKPWEEIAPPGLPTKARAFERRVADGFLTAVVGQEPSGWHLSVSFRDHKATPSRYPRWDEIADARENFLPHDREFGMMFPKIDNFVNVHHSVFHLFEFRQAQVPAPTTREP